MERLITPLITLFVVIFLLLSSVFVVSEKEYAVVFALGKLERVIKTPGLHFKLPSPFQSVVKFDRRILTIDNRSSERVQTSEKKNLSIDYFVKWRISDPRQFFITFGSSDEGAQQRLSALVRDAINASINRRTVRDVTSQERDKIMKEIRTKVALPARDLGVEVVDVRLKRVGFVAEISESVFRRMETERKRVANAQRAAGSAEGERIRADADRQREVILADAYRDAQKIKGEGDAKAARIYAQSFGQDREFARLYRSLEAYKETFNKPNDVLVVDPSSDFFKFMKGSPAGK